MSVPSIYFAGGKILGASGGVYASSGGGGSGNPTPTGYSGSLAASGTFTVTGSGFGANGPNIVLVEDFESDTPGSKVSLTGPVIGQWSSYNNSNGYTASNVAAHTGSVSFNAVDANQVTNGTGTQFASNQLTIQFGEQQEAFLSYWVYTPNQQFNGEYGNEGGPGVLGTIPDPGNFAYDSCWKMCWFQKSLNDISGTDFNMVIPSYASAGQFQVAGESQVLISNFGNTWWSFTTWNRLSTWLRGAPNQGSGQSAGNLQTLNTQKGMNTFQFGTSPLFQSGNTYFSSLNIVGYTAVASKTQQPLYDDIYLAVNPSGQLSGACARVEIGDAATYTACQHMTILLATSWADGSVTSTVPRAGLDFSGQAYAYVWNGNGTVNATGLAV